MIQRLNINQLINLMRKGFHVEVRVLLMPGLFSRHELSLDGRTVIDFSYVDGSETRYSIRRFRKESIVARAAGLNNLILEQKRR